ncbi:MAG TPA: ABC transporter permease [Bryobacteraceae bacterium]|nr:ABC transporter permease [Bryobacteraceae bacterium]
MTSPMRVSGKEILAMALGAIAAHKLRSGLTILGIVIGITTVVTVASLLTGLNNEIVDFFKEFGPDSIFVGRLSGDPSGQNAPPKERKRRPIELSYADYIKNTVHSISDVALSVYVIPPAGSVPTAKVPGYESDNFFIQGVTPNLYDISPRDVRQGRIFSEPENRRAARVAVLGSSLADALFPRQDGVGRTVMLDGAEYTVVGVFAPAKGGFFGENNMDRQAIIPFETARLRYPQSNNYYITTKAKPGERDDAVEEERAALRKLRHVPAGKEDDFTLSTPDSIIQNFNKITSMILLISIAISGVGLLVGGIGVMNIMLVSVTERTREIGVRKAIGARKSDIVTQFLVEAMALTGAGGIIGVIFSILVTLAVSAIVPSLRTEVPPLAVVAGFSISVAIGVFFGVWPAVKASQLDPVEALRYE